MRIIALEEHITTPDIAAAARMPGTPASDYLRSLGAKLLDVGDGRIADMDAAGIDLQVLSLSANTVDRLDSDAANALVRDANDRMAAAVQAHPGRFAAFATVALHEPEKAAAELERAVRQLGAKGLMLSGTFNGRFLDDPRFSPVFEAAQALDVPVYLHPAPPPPAVMEAYYSGLPGALGFFLATSGWGWHVETGMHSLRMIVTGLFDRFPRLKMIIGHMGENLPFSIARAEMAMGRGNPSLQRRISEYFCDNFWITTSGYFTNPPFLCALQVVGIDRILFSVDYPFSSNDQGRKFLDGLSISPDDMAKLTHRNAENLLKL